jgi:signal peptidase I
VPLAIGLSLIAFVACVSKGRYTQLEEQYQALQGELGRVQAANAVLEASNADSEEKLSGLQASNAALEEPLSALQSSKGELEKKLSGLKGTNLELDKKLSELTLSYATLMNEVGGVETLRHQRQSLLDSISALHQQRTALIPATSEGGFVCSGSMDPTITCMDRATWLDNPRPEEVVVGGVISFQAPSGCRFKDTSRSIAHRVTSVTTQAGEYQFRTKGVNNAVDDSCWIPFANVNGLMLGLDKGSNAQMQALSHQVWPLEAERNQLELGMLALTHELNQLRTEYHLLYAKYCSGVPKGQKCIVAHEAFVRIEQRQQTMRAHLTRHEALVDRVNLLRNQLEGLRCTKLYACVPVTLK